MRKGLTAKQKKVLFKCMEVSMHGMFGLLDGLPLKKVFEIAMGTVVSILYCHTGCDEEMSFRLSKEFSANSASLQELERQMSEVVRKMAPKATIQ